MNEDIADIADIAEVAVAFDTPGDEHLDLLRLPVSRSSAKPDTSADGRSSRAKEWIRGILAVTALFGLCGVGALSLNRTPSIELPSRPPNASWLAGDPAAFASACTHDAHDAPDAHDSHAPATPRAREPSPPTKILATAAPSAKTPAPSAQTTPATPTTATPPIPASAGILPDGRIVLNTATAEELTRLKGIGMKRATAIVALRTRLGGFKRVSSLLRVRGIGVRTLKRLRPHLVLNRPEPEPGPEPEPEPKPAPNVDGPSTDPPGPTNRDPEREPESQEVDVRQLRASIR